MPENHQWSLGVGPEERIDNGRRAKDGQASSGRVVRQGIDRKEDVEQEGAFAITILVPGASKKYNDNN
jgi:hypothetical protein